MYLRDSLFSNLVSQFFVVVAMYNRQEKVSVNRVKT